MHSTNSEQKHDRFHKRSTNLKASLHFSTRSQYTNLARHGNEQLNTSKLESQKQNQDEVAAPLPCRPNFRSHFTPCHSKLRNCHYEL